MTFRQTSPIGSVNRTVSQLCCLFFPLIHHPPHSATPNEGDDVIICMMKASIF